MSVGIYEIMPRDEVQANLDNHSSQLTVLTSMLQEFTYNLNALRNTRGNKYINALAIGDSIAAGTAAGSNFGFLQQLLSATNILNANNTGGSNFWAFYNNTSNGGSLSNWNPLNTGIGNWVMQSQASSTALLLFPFSWVTPQYQYQVKLVYSKRPDGGNFQVGYGSTVLDTLSSNGTSQDGIISNVYTIPAGQVFSITPIGGQTAYVSHAFYSKDFTKNGPALDLWVQGGRKAKDFADADLITMLTYQPRNLLIWELLANDYSGGDFASYQDRTNTVISKAKSLGMDVLITVTNGNSSTPNDPNWRNQWVSYLYGIAQQYDCALIDYDKFMGGYTKAYGNGLIQDTIHPTDMGHLLMANVLIPILMGVENPYNKLLQVWSGDTRRLPYGYINDARNLIYTGNIAFNLPYIQSNDNNGNLQYNMVQPIIRASNSPSQLPKYAPIGAIASYGTALYINGTDWGTNQNTSPATWTQLYTQVMQEVVTSLPTPTLSNRGRTVILSASGSDDTMHVCIETSTGTFVWKSVTLT